MLSVGEDVEADALFKRGWTISAIARHLGRDRKTVRSYLSGERVPGCPPSGRAPTPWPTTAAISRPASTTTRTCGPGPVRRGRRARLWRLVCELRPPGPLGRVAPALRGVLGGKGPRDHRDRPPRRRGNPMGLVRTAQGPVGRDCYVLLGTLSHSGRTRGVLSESMDQPHLIEAMDAVMRRLGGTARKWRTDRLATVIVPGSADVQASFAPVAKHYGAIVAPCPPRRGNRKGAVECGVKFCCGRWWRTMTATTAEEAQVSLDRFWSTTGDARLRPPGRYAEPDELAGNERTSSPWPSSRQNWPRRGADGASRRPLPGHHRGRAARRRAGQRGLSGQPLLGRPGDGRHRAHAATAPRHRHTARSSRPPGPCSCRTVLATPGAGQMVRTAEHRAALEAVVLGQFSAARPCDRKANRPPGREALAERARLVGHVGDEPSVDLEDLAEVIALAFPGSIQVSA